MTQIQRALKANQFNKVLVVGHRCVYFISILDRKLINPLKRFYIQFGRSSCGYGCYDATYKASRKCTYDYYRLWFTPFR